MKVALLDTFKEGIQILERKGFPDARISCEELLAHVTHQPRVKIYTEPKDEIPGKIRDKFIQLVKKRAKHEPLQYLIGQVPFRNAQIRIQKGTLIPRPETEILVETVLKKIAEKKSVSTKILDVGTGSGCVAISLAQECSLAQIHATDISVRSLKLAAHNAEANQVRSRIVFRKVSYWPKDFEKFDWVVSNPPYLSTKDFDHLQPELEFEPKQALFAGRDGLRCYRFMICHAGEILKSRGGMAFEVGMGQAQTVATMFKNHGFHSIEITKDLSGIERIVLAELRN